MKLSVRLAMAAASLAMIGAGAASADTLLNYKFDAGSHYALNGVDSPVSGSFTLDVTTQVLSNVTYTRGPDTFTIGSVTGPGATAGNFYVYLGDTNSGDYDVYKFAHSLDAGGADTIIAAFHPNIEVTSVGGSISAPAVGGVPEPASWALMLMGFGLIGSAVRGRKLAVSAV